MRNVQFATTPALNRMKQSDQTLTALSLNAGFQTDTIVIQNCSFTGFENSLMLTHPNVETYLKFQISESQFRDTHYGLRAHGMFQILVLDSHFYGPG